MKPITKDQLARWRAEIDLGLEFRDKEFGTYRKQAPGSPPQTTLAGRNLDYFEQGGRTDEFLEPPLNIVYPIVKNVVPTLFFQNPRATATPLNRNDEASDDAFYASTLINQDLKDPDFRFKDTSQGTVFDSFVLGYGVVKVGYATEFGSDILPTEAEDRKKEREKAKSVADKLLEGLGLKKPKKQEETEPEKVHSDLVIKSEKPYVVYINPFDFVVDPRACDLTDAKWVAQRIRRTVADIKADRRYSSAKNELKPENLDDNRIQDSFVEEFQTVDIWEVHYKDGDSPTGISILTFAATQTQTKALMHEDNVYDLGGWQYEWLTLNKHGHRLYPISTISIIRPLIDRINSSFDAILEQVDKFVAKIAYNDRVSPEGEMALEDGTIGARVKITGQDDVRSAIAPISMDQVRAEMVNFVDKVMDMVILIVGLTRAQLTGLTTAQTATEAQIGQGGQNLRRTDEAGVVAAWTNRVVTKLWRVKAQFQPLDEIDLVQESAVPNPETGLASTQFYPPIDSLRADRLRSSKFRFHIEVSSMQKPNLEIVRAQFENVMKALMNPVVTNGLALEGKRISASEAIRLWARFFEEVGFTEDFSKLIVPIADPMMQQTLLNFAPRTRRSQGSNGGVASAPNRANIISSVAGEKGQGFSPV